MKTNYFIRLTILIATASFAGCTSDTLASEIRNSDSDIVTHFCAQSDDYSQTRSSRYFYDLDKHKGQLRFYWLADADEIWCNHETKGWVFTEKFENGQNENQYPEQYAPYYMYSSGHFIFEKIDFTKDKYKIRYMGHGNASDKVTIASLQRQSIPDCVVEMGKYGDCGVGTAMRDPKDSKKYNITVTHKASYLTFSPYLKEEDTYKGYNLIGIEIYSLGSKSKPICGTYKFSDEGIDTKTSPENSDKHIMLRVGENCEFTPAPDYNCCIKLTSVPRK